MASSIRDLKTSSNWRRGDENALALMDFVARKSADEGTTLGAEALARHALIHLGFRKATKNQIGDADIKRLALKFKAGRCENI